MKIDLKTLNRLIIIVIIISTISIIFSFRNFTSGEIVGDVKSVHIKSADNEIDFYTEDQKYCKFLDLYFETFVENHGEEVYVSNSNLNINAYPLVVNITTQDNKKYSVLLREDQYDVSKVSFNDLEVRSRAKDIPTMSYLKTENSVNYYTVSGVSDDVLNAFINTAKY